MTTEQTATGATITITDKDGAHTATIANGERGPQGDKGDPGDPAAPGAITTEYLADGAVTLDKLYQPLAEAITLKGSDSGETVTTDDAAELPLLSLTVHGKSVQDGTPTPDNPVEVQVVRAPNIFDKTTATIKRYIDRSGNVQTSNGWSVSDFIPVESGHTYVLSGVTQGWSGVACMAWYKADKSFLSYNEPTVNPLTAPENAAYTRLSLKTENVNTVQFERGTVASHYCEYGCIGLQIGETVTPIDLQGHTLAGGDILRVNAAGHVWIERHAIIRLFDGTDMDGWSVAASGNYAIYRDYSIPDSQSVTLTDSNSVSNRFRHVNIGDATTALGYGNTNRTMRFKPFSETVTLSNLQAFFTSNPTVIIVPCPETTIELGTITPPTPIDGGTVRVVANVTPEIDATWIKDATKAHSDIATTDASIAAVESTVATSNHAIGSYFVVENQLYKATRAIATGETIAPGTNCTATTVMAELVALTS